MPEGVAAASIASRQITLTWVEPHDNNAPIMNYQVQYLQPEFVTGNREVIVTTTVTMATLTSLYPGVTYIFTITAHNTIGSSLPSLRAIVRTLDEGKSLNESINNILYYSLLSTEAERGNPPQSDTIADTVADIIADTVADTIADAFADVVADARHLRRRRHRWSLFLLLI